VTPPAGSRDDDADSDPHREAAPGPADAPDRPRDDERDPQLRAMRAVWLAMRDEDPPDRGLADLLAAARQQAAAMQPRPSVWWQRLLAALRRPPVLAFATVAVLIAGAVLIGRRVPREAAPDTRTATAPARPVPPAAEPATADHAGAAPARDALPMPPPGAPAPAAAAPPVRPSSVRPPAHTATPASPAPPSGEVIGATIGADEDRAAAGSPPEPPAPAVDQAASEKATRLGAFSDAPSDDSGAGATARTAPARPSRAAPQAEPAPGAARHAAGDVANSSTAGDTANNAPDRATRPTADGVAAPARRPSPSPPRGGAAADQYQQCEAAARRSDCTTVRRLVRQIARTDPGYRARIPGDSPVARCLTR
jgi:hypothetical protein